MTPTQQVKAIMVARHQAGERGYSDLGTTWALANVVEIKPCRARTDAIYRLESHLRWARVGKDLVAIPTAGGTCRLVERK